MTAPSPWPPTPDIPSQRLLIRPWRREDLDVMAAWPPFADPLEDVWNWPRELKRVGSLDLFFWMRAGSQQRREWTITRDGEAIGYLSIREIDRRKRSSRLGIGLGAPYVSQGYGTEALRAFVAEYFGALAFQLLRLDVAAHNLRARRCYQSVGFREVEQRWQDEGTVEEFAFLADPRYDAVREDFSFHAGRVLVRTIEMELTQ